MWGSASDTWLNVKPKPDADHPNADCALDPCAIPERGGGLRHPVLRLDGEAHHLFLEWRTDLERNLRSGDLHPALASHLAKYRKLIPTLALINHLADAGHGLIGKHAMMRAL